MKKILFLWFITYIFCEASSLPSSVTAPLCRELAELDNRCENGSVIQYDGHYVMQNGNLLLFVYLDPQTVYRGPMLPITKTILLVDKHGKWQRTKGTNKIQETIQTFSQTPNGHLFIRTHWLIEGVYPALFDSKDGITWQRIILPETRDVDCCFEHMEEPCLQAKNIILTFKNNEGTVSKSWRSDYDSVYANKPLWQPTQHTSSCLTSPVNTHWKGEASDDTITFTHQTTHAKVTLSNVPRGIHQLKEIYYIQIGAFTQTESLNAVRNALNALSHDYEFIRKEVIINNQHYTKLLIGEYTTQQKAQTILDKLKRIYTKNKYIQNAFVMSLAIENK